MAAAIRMDPGALVREARLAEALSALQEEVRQSPHDVERRVQLFALNCVLGRYERAHDDLDVIQSIDSTWSLAAQLYRRLIAAELLRREVFAGRARPTVLGKPEPWIAWNVQSLALEAEGKLDAALELRTQAWQAAPECAASVDGKQCAWLSDADRRLGPLLEAIVDGSYYWIPFSQLTQIAPGSAEYILDAVWVPTRLGLSEQREVAAYIFARYCGSETSGDDGLSLGRLTRWCEQAGGGVWPMGQKLLESPDAEFPLLECHRIDFLNTDIASTANA